MSADPFGWLRELKNKPIQCCIGCRAPYFPSLGECNQCENLMINTLYIHAAQLRMNDEFWRRWQERHQRHG